MSGEKIYLDFEYFVCIDKVIEEAVIDQWLTNDSFCSAYEDYCEWVLRMQDTWSESDDKDDAILEKIEAAAIELGLRRILFVALGDPVKEITQ